MKAVNVITAQGSIAEIKGVTELEHFDLYPDFKSAISEEQFAAVKRRTFASLQLRARKAVKKLLASETDRILVLCGNVYSQSLTTAQEILEDLGISGSSYKVLISPGKSELFGSDKNCIKGLVLQEKLLLMPSALFLDHPKWGALMQRAFAENSKLKLILTGDASEIAALSIVWPLTITAIYSDLISEFRASGAAGLMGAIAGDFAKRFNLKPLSCDAACFLAVWAARQSGDRRWLGLPRAKLISLLSEASCESKGPVIEKSHILKAVAAADFRENFLAESQLRDHRDRQILIATSGAVIGQINGLSVVETAGSSYEFGEPVRITASLKAGGEGDVIDIERKAELAGQIHAKAMMIINGYVTREFGSETPLPVSASLVFEQSYSEIDGDSASLTGLCAVISCLSEIPLRQDLAVTGAVDQFGDVQPVGAVNEKIEGFFKVCRLHGLTGTQGVIIPLSCVNQLVLRPAVVNAVRKGRFHLYTVSHVKEAFELLSLAYWGDAHTEGSVVQRIVSRLYEIGSGRHESPWWKFWER